jgi:hypothetical protein
MIIKSCRTTFQWVTLGVKSCRTTFHVAAFLIILLTVA